ncbi:hypothetical protein EZ456_13220 [Pedobacter psychrodurus]|uniref:Hypervirulence associated protein TUDOR domain-containing protein n=1 Tax=Pedobacter psychrodurus TaxID=2530456 RepID=A0A4R0PWP5_9SPHI|nr:hypothetical protein [Pedobacter psychrodurus]TCD26544.1 hypothetical protein EZ456_13220 [Pedobacter psychrodurus]
MKKVTPLTSTQDLEKVKVGDQISDNTGKSGTVESVEVLHYDRENQYYYKIKNNGTVLVIK